MKFNLTVPSALPEKHREIIDYLIRHSASGGVTKFQVANAVGLSPKTAALYLNQIRNMVSGDPLVCPRPTWRWRFSSDIDTVAQVIDSTKRDLLTRARNASHHAQNAATVGLPSTMVRASIPKPDMKALEG